jgi:hypothetical protein
MVDNVLVAVANMYQGAIAGAPYAIQDGRLRAFYIEFAFGSEDDPQTSMGNLALFNLVENIGGQNVVQTVHCHQGTNHNCLQMVRSAINTPILFAISLSCPFFLIHAGCQTASITVNICSGGDIPFPS